MSVPTKDNPTAYQPPLRGQAPDELLLDLNEGAPVLSESQVTQIAASVGVDGLRRYPDPSALTAQLAARLGLDASGVLVTNGGDDAIDRLCRAFLREGDEIVLPSPTFEMIGRYAQLAGAAVRRVDWWGGDFPLDGVLGACGERTKVVAVVSPNNPTGAVITPDQLTRLSESLPGAVLKVDLAYTEFADTDLTEKALKLPNAVVIRTFSKAYGLAGARVGYAAGPAGLIDVMRASGGPFPCSALSLALAREALGTPAEQFSGQIDRVRAQRSTLTELLRARGCEVIESQANFVLARLANSDRVWEVMGQRGVRVRRFTQPELAGWLRIGCPGTDLGFVRLVSVLESVLSRQDSSSQEDKS